MTKTITMRVDESFYQILKTHADSENRSISNLLETAAKHYLEEIEFVDDLEMDGILKDTALMNRLRSGTDDAINKRGRFA